MVDSISTHQTPEPPPIPFYEKAIWNPNAAVNWSLLFTPAFGAYVQMLNWKILEQPKKEQASRAWFLASLANTFICTILDAFVYDNSDVKSVRIMGFLFLMVWYFSFARFQSKYVKETLGKEYAKKPWRKPLLLALGGLSAYFVICLMVGFLVGLVQYFFLKPNSY